MINPWPQHKRRIIFTDTVKNIVCSQAHARVPNSIFQRDCWINLCLDLPSFLSDCFGKQAFGTPQLHGKPAPVQSERDAHSHGYPTPPKPQTQGVKQIESIVLEGGNLRVRKLICSKFQIPPDNFDEIASGGHCHGEEIFDNGVRVENLPKNLDFLAALSNSGTARLRKACWLRASKWAVPTKPKQS